MLIVMDKKATAEEIETVVAAVEARGYTARPIPGGERVSIGVLYNKGAVDASLFLGYPGVKDVVPVTRPYKLVSREFQHDDTMVTVGNVTLDVYHCPGHTPGHVVFFSKENKVAFVGDVLFRGSIGRTDFPRGDFQTLINSITNKLWPLGNDVTFVSGHRPLSTFGEERQHNGYVADSVLN